MRRDVGIALLVGIACALAVFPGAVVGRRSLVPSAALRADPVMAPDFPGKPPLTVWDPSGVLTDYPQEAVAARELRRGRLPLWNPYVGTGVPLLGAGDVAVLSPFWLPYWISPSEMTYSWGLLLRLVVAAAGAYLVARRRGASELASGLAAVAYGLGGPFAARFDMPTEGTAYAMLPLVTLAALAVRDRGWRRVPLLGIAVGATIYAAHPECAALAAGGGLLFVVAERPRAIGRLAAGSLLGVAIGALAILPLVDYLRHGGASYKTDPAMLRHLAGDVAYLRIEPLVVRVGGAVLFLALLGRRWRTLGALGGLALLLFAIQLGPILSLRGLVPPKYGLFLVAFALADSAATGLDRLRDASWRDVGLAAAGATALWLALDRIVAGGLGPAAVWDAVALASCVAIRAVPRARRPGRRHRRLAGAVVRAPEPGHGRRRRRDRGRPPAPRRRAGARAGRRAQPRAPPRPRLALRPRGRPRARRRPPAPLPRVRLGHPVNRRAADVRPLQPRHERPRRAARRRRRRRRRARRPPPGELAHRLAGRRRADRGEPRRHAPRVPRAGAAPRVARA
jgi:hypothetical protein